MARSATASASGSAANARGVSRNILRDIWSSTITAASAVRASARRLSASSPYPDLYSAGLRSAPGAILRPIPHSEGWSVIRVLDRRRWSLPYESVKTQITERMHKDRFSSAREVALDELRPQYPVKRNEKALEEIFETAFQGGE